MLETTIALTVGITAAVGAFFLHRRRALQRFNQVAHLEYIDRRHSRGEQDDMSVQVEIRPHEIALVFDGEVGALHRIRVTTGLSKHTREQGETLILRRRGLPLGDQLGAEVQSLVDAAAITATPRSDEVAGAHPEPPGGWQLSLDNALNTWDGAALLKLTRIAPRPIASEAFRWLRRGWNRLSCRNELRIACSEWCLADEHWKRKAGWRAAFAQQQNLREVWDAIGSAVQTLPANVWDRSLAMKAINAMAEVSDSRATDGLYAMLDWREDDVRALVAHHLTKLGNVNHVEGLLQAEVRGPDHVTRAARQAIDAIQERSTGQTGAVSLADQHPAGALSTPEPPPEPS